MSIPEINSKQPERQPLSIDQMKSIARKMRRDIVSMIGAAGSGHPGGSLSAVEILTALYFKVLRHDPSNPRWEDRDRFILSKGHAAPVLYAALSECGYIPESELRTLRKIDSRLQGHPECTLTPGVEMSAGALGQGLSYAIGAALAARLDAKNYYTYVLIGDGECDEGQIWEAAMAAAHFKLDRLIAVVDNNGIQIDGWNKDVMNIEPLADKWKSFNWNVLEIDGNNLSQVIQALESARASSGRPSVIIAHTVKGAGVSFMENNPDFHGKAPGAEELQKALKELE
ncbi:MAG: transketolase [Dehalococcoidales bacterium]|nr:transketolase [Dehalococcoidales bacterium]